MSCDAYFYSRRVQEDIGKVKGDVDSLKRLLQGDLKTLFSDLSTRLDKMDACLEDMELAIVDPHGEGYERIRKRHGKGKPRAVAPMKSGGSK